MHTYILLILFGFHAQAKLCKPDIYEGIYSNLTVGGHTSLECELYNCDNVDKVVFEKTNIVNFTTWTPVFEEINSTCNQAIGTGNNLYSLNNRNEYHAFRKQRILYISSLTVKDQGKWRCVVYDQTNGSAMSQNLHLFFEKPCNMDMSKGIYSNLTVGGHTSLECDLYNCDNADRVVFEKTHVVNSTSWIPVFEEINTTNYHIIDTGNSLYSLNNRNEYHAFRKQRILYISPLTDADQGKWRCVWHDTTTRRIASTTVHLFFRPILKPKKTRPKNKKIEKMECVFIDWVLSSLTESTCSAYGISSEPDTAWMFNAVEENKAAVCRPKATEGVNNQIEIDGFLFIDCAFSTCTNVSKVTFEKHVDFDSYWVPVFEGINSTFFRALTTPKFNYSLEDRNVYGTYSTKHTLFIKPLKIQDHGEWRCFVLDVNGYYSPQTLEVDICVIPKDGKVNIEPRLPALVINELADFTCTVEGIHPEPFVKWTVNGTGNYSGKSANKKRSDGLWSVKNTIQLGFNKAGELRLSCVMQDKKHKTVLKNEVTMYIKNRAKVLTPYEDIELITKTNSTFTLNCSGTGYNPNIFWKKDGDILDTDMGYTIEKRCNNSMCTGSLTSRPVDPELYCVDVMDYSGVYTCIIAMDSPYQSTQVSARMNVLGKQCRETYILFQFGVALSGVAVVASAVFVWLLLRVTVNYCRNKDNNCRPVEASNSQDNYEREPLWEPSKIQSSLGRLTDGSISAGQFITEKLEECIQIVANNGIRIDNDLSEKVKIFTQGNIPCNSSTQTLEQGNCSTSDTHQDDKTNVDSGYFNSGSEHQSKYMTQQDNNAPTESSHEPLEETHTANESNCGVQDDSSIQANNFAIVNRNPMTPTPTQENIVSDEENHNSNNIGAVYSQKKQENDTVRAKVAKIQGNKTHRDDTRDCENVFKSKSKHVTDQKWAFVKPSLIFNITHLIDEIKMKDSTILLSKTWKDKCMTNILNIKLMVQNVLTTRHGCTEEERKDLDDIDSQKQDISLYNSLTTGSSARSPLESKSQCKDWTFSLLITELTKVMQEIEVRDRYIWSHFVIKKLWKDKFMDSIHNIQQMVKDISVTKPNDDRTPRTNINSKFQNAEDQEEISRPYIPIEFQIRTTMSTAFSEREPLGSNTSKPLDPAQQGILSGEPSEVKDEDEKRVGMETDIQSDYVDVMAHVYHEMRDLRNTLEVIDSSGAVASNQPEQYIRNLKAMTDKYMTRYEKECSKTH